MGEFRFRIPDFWEIETYQTRTVHIIGIDGVPRPCNINLEGKLLIVRRNQNESGKTYISYPFTTRGDLTICTGTLPESDKVYNLIVELARGTINRLRNQTSIWEEGGLEIPSEVSRLTKMATGKLGRSLTGSGSEVESDELAKDALDLAIEAIFKLSEHFGKEIAEFRVSEAEIPHFWFSISGLESSKCDSFDSFDLISISANEALEFRDSLPKKKIILGPLLDASPMSDFSNQGSGFEAARKNLINQCDKILENMPSRTVLFHAACNLNGIGHKNLSYRQQIQLTSDLVSKIDDSKHDVPVMVSFDYPWAERLAWSVGGIHPLQIADDIMRNGTRIAFIGLDINLDYWPCGSIARDPLQWIDLIDLWSQLGLPLILCLRVPQKIEIAESELESDSMELLHSNHEDNVTIAIEAERTTEFTNSEKIVVGNSVRENLNQSQRLDLLKTVLPMAIARPGVHGVLWRQWNDNVDPRFPNAGLVDRSNTAKPTLNVIQNLRKTTLKR